LYARNAPETARPRIASRRAGPRSSAADSGRGERREHEQALVRCEQLGGRAQTRERDAEQALVVGADHVVARRPRVDHGVLVGELERVSEGPCIEGGEWDDAADDAERIRRQVSPPRVPRKGERQDPQRKLDHHREAGEQARDGDHRAAPAGAALAEQQPEGSEAERRREKVCEEQGREREDERAEPDQDRRGRAVARDQAVGGAPHEE
jgi:hypothetical protein